MPRTSDPSTEERGDECSSLDVEPSREEKGEIVGGSDRIGRDVGTESSETTASVSSGWTSVGAMISLQGGRTEEGGCSVVPSVDDLSRIPVEGTIDSLSGGSDN